MMFRGYGRLLRSFDGREKEEEPYPIEIRHYGVCEIVRRLGPLVRPHRLRLAAAASLVALVGLAVAIGPLFTRRVIDDAIPKKDIRLAMSIMGVYLVTQFTRMGLWYMAQWSILWMREDVVFRMRSQSFHHLQRLCLRFHNKFPSGFLYERVFGRSINTIGAFLATIFSNFTIYAAGLLFSLWFCLHFSPQMTLVIVAGALGYVVAGRTLAPRIRAKMLIYINEGNKITQYIVDKLRGTKTIQAFSMEDRVQLDFESRVWPMQVKYIEAQREEMRLHFVIEGLGYLLTAAVMVCGAYAIFNWNMTLGELTAFIGYQGMLTGMIASITSVYGQMGVARAGFDQLYTVLDTQSTVVDKPGAVMPPEIRGRIEFRDATFAYETKPVLQKLSFSVEPGQTVALVGRSGGGKTTIANLLMRFYDSDSGGVYLDDTNVRDLPLRPYRALFGVVLQDPFLFDDTIAANLLCAKPDATDDELAAALDKARALEFVRDFPAGINQKVGEGGGQLSGGQRQRVAIARCMLLQPRFLLLDEATSSLDNEAESYIQHSFDALFEGRTVFIIAHRLSTIRRADRILVVDSGRIVEDGTFEQLIAREGLFRHLYSIATSTSSHKLKIEEAGFA